MKNKTQKSAVATNATNEKFYNDAKSLVQCSNYVKNSKLTLTDVKKFIDASLKVLETKDLKAKIATMYLKNVDFNNKEYKRIERVFSSLVAKELNLSTSTSHEKITESVNLANRQLIRSFFSYTDTQLDSIRELVYKFKV